ncbi:hypothetical protein RJ639_020710 [Escallonia herrerae]|uniref:FLZ-type domain-containing protein n=1 Tax=Escallonia herrerae TaxID=1293975 RepID=A0AA88V3S4_9ASTE|nr:hypothetical protein RJ639_020710 [Escallonia herrerae]
MAAPVRICRTYLVELTPIAAVVMLRNRSRRVTSKQAIMADHTTLPSPTQNYNRPNSSFFGSPRFFCGVLGKLLSDAETVTSPTSILETKQLSNFGNPFGYDKNTYKPTTTFLENNQAPEKLDSEGIGLALIDDLSKPNSKMVLFKSKLKIQIPSAPLSISTTESPNSPGDFGVKTRNSQFQGTPTAFGSVNPCIQTKGSLSLSEMELSEEYTCVISHGPSPRTTHIYDNCIVESCCGVTRVSELKKEDNLKSPPVQSFLSFCYACKKDLSEGRDIYMYRGEKAFCSDECRCQEMLLDGVENLDGAL